MLYFLICAGKNNEKAVTAEILPHAGREGYQVCTAPTVPCREKGVLHNVGDTIRMLDSASQRWWRLRTGHVALIPVLHLPRRTARRALGLALLLLQGPCDAVQVKRMVAGARQDGAVVARHAASGAGCLVLLTTDATSFALAVPHPLRHEVDALYLDIHGARLIIFFRSIEACRKLGCAVVGTGEQAVFS